MKVKIEKLNVEITLKYLGEKVRLSQRTKNRIDKFWNNLKKKEGKCYYRGEVFTIDNFSRNIDNIISVKQTDYAHYVYTLHNPKKPREAPCRVFHTSALIETSDGFFVFGEMAKHTAHAGKFQCVGGGIDLSDLENGIFNLEKNISRELEEEVGIKLNGKNLMGITEKYLKTGGVKNSIALIYLIKTRLTKNQFQEHYKKFVSLIREKKEKPEFAKLCYIRRDKINSKIPFLLNKSDEYLIPVLKQVLSEE